MWIRDKLIWAFLSGTPFFKKEGNTVRGVDSTVNMEIGKGLSFYEESSVLPGVKRAAECVKKDICLVTDCEPDLCAEGDMYSHKEAVVIYGTIGHSSVLERIDREKGIHLSEIKGKWEVYSFQIVEAPLPNVEKALVIAGSDKRGTIYGLYHLSELMGVSPLVNWNHVWPEKREKVILTDRANMVSKEPSVKYRGFFINDEWPAFGTWAELYFGGINAECYEKIFELLLRLKGNYLWPAMWNSNFNIDGPGLRSAELADEYGVVMSTSHHEPCMRSGEEYGMLRGEGSIYGDAWDFRKNRAGITQFWKDGLLRNKAFENVITLGMRGERDTAILGQEATLQDNINLLRDVLKAQNELIRDTMNQEPDDVPRQIVLFTEVEEFFYGNADARGLKDDPELEGVTLILSDNNHGFTRTLPTADMRDHKGGYGMYYHMDMHGGAHSYQWIGSTYIPRVWEQMTMAYDFGVKEIWVTNIGDIGTQEYGLSFFLDLAYDMDQWGGEEAEKTIQYTREWVRKHFSASFSADDQRIIEKIIWDYTGLLARRKHETMNAQVYHPLHFGEAEEVLQISEEILEKCHYLKTKCAEQNLSAFISLIFYPACGTANLMKMWILAGRNELFAKQNRMEANVLADQITVCVQKDKDYVEEYQSIDNGYYNGFGLSEHIGFTNWNDEDNKFPVRHYIFPANHPRMLVSRVDDTEYMTGLYWTDHPQVWSDMMRPDINEIAFDLSSGSNHAFAYKIKTDCEWMSFSKTEGIVDFKERIVLSIHRELIDGKVKGSFQIENKGYGAATVYIEAENNNNQFPDNVFLENDGYISIEARHYQKKADTCEGGFRILHPYGRIGSGIKAYPVTKDFLYQGEGPYVEYHFLTETAGGYRIRFYMAASTPVGFNGEQYIGYSLNEEPVQKVNTVLEPDKPFFLSEQWTKEAFDNTKIIETEIDAVSGINSLRFFALSPAIVLEKIVIYRKDRKLKESYLGPKESYRKAAFRED